MNTLHTLGARALMLVAASTLAAGAWAQQAGDQNVPPAVVAKQAREVTYGDPARWYREDATDAARLRTLQKEIGAALTEARTACRKLSRSARADCLKEASTIYRQDMNAARITR